VKYKISPRLGISHPVSDRTVLHVFTVDFFKLQTLMIFFSTLIRTSPDHIRASAILI